MTIKSKKPIIKLSRRKVLKAGGMGILGIIASSSTGMLGLQKVSAANIHSNLKKLRIGDFNPNYAAQWSWRLAQGLGYMEEVGIMDFEVFLTDEYIPGLIGGSLDITHGDTSEFFGAGKASGLPIKMINLYRDKEWWIMGVRKGINTFDDLRGGKITGGGLGGRNTWIMRQILKANGLDPDKDVEMVPMKGGSDGRMKALIAEVVDGASVFPRHESRIVESGGKFISAELTNAPQEGFGSMGDWLDKNEDAAHAFVHADLRARLWLFDPKNKSKAYKIMRDYGYDVPPEFEAMYQTEINQIAKDGGWADSKTMDDFVKSLQATGALPKDIRWQDYVELKYLWAAQEALGLPNRPAYI